MKVLGNELKKDVELLRELHVSDEEFEDTFLPFLAKKYNCETSGYEWGDFKFFVRNIFHGFGNPERLSSKTDSQNDFKEVFSLMHPDKTKESNFLWKRWKDKKEITKEELFMQLSYGNSVKTVREYEALVRLELGVSIFEFESNCDYPYMFTYPDKVVKEEYEKRTFGRELERLVGEYVCRVNSAFESLEKKYEVEDLREIYPGLKISNFRNVLPKDDVQLIEQYINNSSQATDSKWKFEL